MVREYELMYIVRPDVDDDGLRQATDSVESLIGGLGGEVEKTTLWGKRRLAYEVKHLRDGHYVITHLKLDGEQVKEIERALRIHDTVFRHLLVLRDGVGELNGGEEKPLGRAGEEVEGTGAATPAAATAIPAAATAARADADAADDDVEAPEAEEEE
jgi:small subunit ribosomal protein S6